METVQVVLRAIASLIVVVGLIVWLGKRFNQDGSGAMIAQMIGNRSTPVKRSRAPRFSLSRVFTVKPKQPGVVTVVARSGLVGRSAISVIDVDGQRLVLGITDTNVSVLHSRALTEDELAAAVLPAGTTSEESADDFAEALDNAVRASEGAPNSTEPVASADKPSRMDGSVLSPNTWRQAKAAIKAARVGSSPTPPTTL